MATLECFDAYYGVFRSGVKRRPLVEPVSGLPTHVLVRESEEKGSDVNRPDERDRCIRELEDTGSSRCLKTNSA